MTEDQPWDEEALVLFMSGFPRTEAPKVVAEPKPLKERRARETTPITANTRRLLRSTETKNVQLNLKVTPSFKAQISAMATARKVSITELIEQAVGAFARRE